MVMICATLTLLLTILCKFGRICATRNALMQLKTILCEFCQICATRNVLMQLKTILCKFGQICATRNALMQLKTILRKFVGNNFMRVWTDMCDQKCSYAGENHFMQA